MYLCIAVTVECIPIAHTQVIKTKRMYTTVDINLIWSMYCIDLNWFTDLRNLTNHLVYSVQKG